MHITDSLTYTIAIFFNPLVVIKKSTIALFNKSVVVTSWVVTDSFKAQNWRQCAGKAAEEGISLLQSDPRVFKIYVRNVSLRLLSHLSVALKFGAGLTDSRAI